MVGGWEGKNTGRDSILKKLKETIGREGKGRDDKEGVMIIHNKGNYIERKARMYLFKGMELKVRI